MASDINNISQYRHLQQLKSYHREESSSRAYLASMLVGLNNTVFVLTLTNLNQ